MSETDDPREALGAKDVKTRAAAARDLARQGSFEDLEVLVGLAKTDKSPSVRLYAAAAGADILARHRGAAGQTPLTSEQIAQVEGWVWSIDPGVNPSLLMLVCSIPTKKTTDRLGRMLRDPRNGVRAGAVAAFRRMALSAAAVGEDRLQRCCGSWLTDRRIPPDVTLELVKLAGEVGWSGLVEEVRGASGHGRPHVEACDEALGELEVRAAAEGYQGFWESDGLDVLEVGEGAPAGWIAVHEDRIGTAAGDKAFSVVDSVGSVDGMGPLRLVKAGKLKQTGLHAALQCDGRTWWKLEGKELVGEIDRLITGFGPEATLGAKAILASIEDVDGALAARARVLARWKSGDVDGCLAALDELLGHKRPRADLFYWSGVIRAEQNDASTAKAHLEQFLEKAGKKAVYRKPAEDLLSSL